MRVPASNSRMTATSEKLVTMVSNMVFPFFYVVIRRCVNTAAKKLKRRVKTTPLKSFSAELI